MQEKIGIVVQVSLSPCDAAVVAVHSHVGIEDRVGWESTTSPRASRLVVEVSIVDMLLPIGSANCR